MIQFLYLLFALTATAAAPASIDGEWRLVSFTCEGGKKDAVVTINARRVARKEVEERITIRGADVTMETVDWANRKARVGCERKSKQRWEIKADTYKVLSLENTGTKAYGDGECPKPADPKLTNLEKTYRKKGKFLELAVNSPSKDGPKNAACAGGLWVRTYEPFKGP